MTKAGGKRGRALLAAATSIIVALLGAVMNADRAAAFAPTTWKSLGSSSHQSMTESAVKDLDNEFFSIRKLTKAMQTAMTQIVDANVATDDDQTHSALHFDGENFAGGQGRLIDLFDKVVADLGAENAKQARVDLGGALHTVQDFYAHSNWIELGNAGPSPDLGRAGHVIGPVAGAAEPTCRGSVLITGKLTSGYYSGEDRIPPIPGKCRHGGPFDHSPGSGGINKDLNNGTISPHSAQHNAASAAAAAATRQFIRDLKGKLTARQLRLLFGVGPTLGMSIDTTGSMGAVIDGVKSQAVQIVDSRIGTDEEPSKYVLAAFNDPLVGPVFTTDDPAAFKAAISSLSADGGDDCPEPSMSGMQQAVSAVDDDGDVFMFTDASPKDAGLAGNVTDLAAVKRVRLFPMIFGDCSTETAGWTGAGETPHFDLVAARSAPIGPSYLRVADDTGGQAFALAADQAAGITKLADRLVRSHAVTLLSITSTLSSAGKTFDVPVDSTTTRVTVSASAAGGTAQTVAVTRPNGTTVRPGDPGVDIISPAAGSAPATIVTVDRPAVGLWRVALAGVGQSSLRVFGESTLDLSAFRFLGSDGVSHDVARSGVDPLPGFPPARGPVGADAVLTDGFRSARFELRTPSGAPMQTLTLPRAGNEFAGLVTLPATSFLVYVLGQDLTGARYQRVVPPRTTPASVMVAPPISADLAAGRSRTYTFGLHNLGPPESYRLSVADDKGFLRSFCPSVLTLRTDETKTVDVVIEAPVGTPDRTPDTITVVAYGGTSSAAHNFATLTNVVTSAGAAPPAPPAGLEARPSVAGWNTGNDSSRHSQRDRRAPKQPVPGR